MKKTIAKIMAAAMVLSTIAAPNVLASELYKGVTVTGSNAARFADGSTLELDGDEVLVDGKWQDLDKLGQYNTEFSKTDKTGFISASDMENLLKGTNSLDYQDSTVTMYTEIAGQPDENGEISWANNSVTAVGATSNNVAVITDTESIFDILDGVNSTLYLKTTVNNKAYNDVVTNDFSSRQYVQWRRTWTFANGWQVRPWFDFSYAETYEIVRQLNAGNAIRVPMAVTVVNPWTNRVIDTGATRWRWFWTANVNQDDDYWNAIVKLKADRNRYTPIRVHVDVQEGSLDGIDGLFVQVVNRTVVNVVRNGVIGTGNITTTGWVNNKLQIQDVQDDDLALLKSDIAKGKNLMLDEAYLFDVTDDLNNNSFAGAGAGYYDFTALGQDTDLGTISIGKITDIRSRLFKDCKEKLVHAKNVKWIRNGAFRKNKQLKKAILSDDTSMKKINEKAFYDCKKLNTVKVKVNTLKQVGKSAFGGSTDKKGLKFNLKAGNKTQYNKAVKLFKKSGVKKAKFRKA